MAYQSTGRTATGRIGRRSGTAARWAAKILALILVSILVGGEADADVVVLKDGRRVEGDVIEETSSKVVVKTAFGELTFARVEVESIERGLTRKQELKQREEAAKTADDFYELGLWAKAQRMNRDAKRCMTRATELDEGHVKAHEYLGHVLYKNKWMTPEERERRSQADHEAGMRDQGLVLYEGEWVTPEAKRRLEQGLVRFEGRWMTVPEAKREQGLELYKEQWLPRAETLAREDADTIGEATGLRLAVAVTPDALLAGPIAPADLVFVGKGLVASRGWFDRTFAAPPGLELFGGRMAELYLWDRESGPYLKSLSRFASWTSTVPDGWVDAAALSHGVVYWDPFPLSSARQWNRNPEDLHGHCYHHWGHMLANRLGYDGRLLPPWYDEGLAGLIEYRTHGRNRVFCRAVSGPGRGTVAKRAAYDIDPADLRRGQWRRLLEGALQENRIPKFDQIAQRELSFLEVVDILASMAIVAWLENQGDGAISRFHAVLRREAPPVPERVILQARDRQAVYDKAFGEAVGMNWREADTAWRSWFLSR
jgi:hypothetical protein